MQWNPVCPAILPSLISVPMWQPDCPHVESTGTKRWTSRPWHVVHCTLRSALESDSRWTRWPAVVEIRFHLSFCLSPCTWQDAQTRVGTLECIEILSGRSATHKYSCRALAKIDGW